MAILNQKRILNLIPKVSAPVTIHVSQGDVGTQIEFTLVKGDEVFVNPGSVTASVHGVREDGANFGPFTCTLSGSKVTFPLHSEMTAVKGSALAEIVIVDNGGNKVGSANFGILVEESVFPLGVTYDNDVSVYESILAYVQKSLTQAISSYISLQAQFDQVISGVTVDSEVINARDGSDGRVYTTLGDAIRTQILDLHKLCDVLSYEHGTFNSKYGKVHIALELGGVNTTVPTDVPSSNRARSDGTLPYNQNYIFKFPYGVKHRFITVLQTINPDYSIKSEIWNYQAWSSDIYDTLGDLAWPAGETRYKAEFRLLVGYDDDRTINSSNIPDIEIIAKILNDDGSIAEAPEYGYYQGNESWAGIGIRRSFRLDTSYIACNFIPIDNTKTYAFNVIRGFVTTNNFSDANSLSGMPALRYFTPNNGENILLFGWRKSDCIKNFYNIDEVLCGAGIDNLIPNLLKGKRLSVLGDSISAFTGHTAGYDPYYNGTNSGVNRYTQMWWQVLCDRTGMVPLVINAETGSGITQLEDSAHINKIPMSSDVRCSGLSDGDINPDIIIIAGGVNDYSYSMSNQSEPLEWDGLTAPIITNSFTEAYACMIKKLQTNYPNAIIVALTTWFTMRGSDNGYTLTHQSGNRRYTQEDYNEAIANVCKQMRIPVIDVSNIGFNRNNFYPTYAIDSSTIPTHPNASGQRIMGVSIAKKLGELVKGYLTDY